MKTEQERKWDLAWVYLLIAGLLEVAWAIGIKYTEAWTRFWPSIATGICMVFSFYFLSLAIKELPIGTAYVVWTGIGAAGTAILGIVLFREPAGAARLVCLALIVAGIVGMRLLAPPHH